MQYRSGAGAVIFFFSLAVIDQGHILDTLGGGKEQGREMNDPAVLGRGRLEEDDWKHDGGRRGESGRKKEKKERPGRPDAFSA